MFISPFISPVGVRRTRGRGMNQHELGGRYAQFRTQCPAGVRTGHSALRGRAHEFHAQCPRVMCSAYARFRRSFS